MQQRNFMELLSSRWDEGKFVCVGLDSDESKLPEHIMPQHARQLAFNKAVVEATADLVCAFKPNLAFYRGSDGKETLFRTIEFIHDVAPGVPVILDGKQGDIGSTNDGYVDEDFIFYGADAVTLHPYLGVEAMSPFLDNPNTGAIVLCRTSNPGAGEFQDLMCEVREGPYQVMVGDVATEADVGIIRTMPLYEVVAHRVAQGWNKNGNCCVVVGATYPHELGVVRAIVGDMPILIPGIGAQGGELEATVKAGANSRGQGMIINSSRGIIFASDGPDFAEAARAVTLKMHDDITAVIAT